MSSAAIRALGRPASRALSSAAAARPLQVLPSSAPGPGVERCQQITEQLSQLPPLPAMLLTALQRDRAYVDGDWVEAGSGAVFPVHSPHSGQLLGTVPDCGTGDTAAAVEAASRAFQR